jgi:hypothetical protein
MKKYVLKTNISTMTFFEIGGRPVTYGASGKESG